MYITLKQYAEMHGKQYSTIKDYAREGRLKTAVKVGHHWQVDSDEPYPAPLMIKDGRYSGWRQKYPIKNPGRTAHRKPPRPVRNVYAVIQETVDKVCGEDCITGHTVLYVFYSYDEARMMYEAEKDFATIFNVSPNHAGKPTERRKVRMEGYRLHTVKGMSPEQVWEMAGKEGALSPSALIYILSDESEWSRETNEKDD